MTSADAPPVTTNPGVDAGIDRASRESFEVALSFSLICPARQPAVVAVTFTDANGESTERLSRPCQGEWANNVTAAPNPLTEWSVMSFPGFAPLLASEAGLPPYVLFTPPPDAAGLHPFLYQVEGTNGIIAQAPITATSTPEARIEEGSAAFEQDCLTAGEVKVGANGHRYCIVSGSTKYATGWPAASSAVVKTAMFCSSESETTRVPRVYPSRCRILGPRQSLADGANLSDLHWKDWGQPEATATGIEAGFHRPAAHLRVHIRAFGRRPCATTEARYTRVEVRGRYGTRVLSLPGCRAT
jgi:hypothetical protein